MANWGVMHKPASLVMATVACRKDQTDLANLVR